MKYHAYIIFLCVIFECVYTLVEVYDASEWNVDFLGG